MTWPINTKYKTNSCDQLTDQGRIVSFDNVSSINEMIGAVLDFHTADLALVRLDIESVGVRVIVTPTHLAEVNADSADQSNLSQAIHTARKIGFTHLFISVNNEGRFSMTNEGELSQLLTGTN